LIYIFIVLKYSIAFNHITAKIVKWKAISSTQPKLASSRIRTLTRTLLFNLQQLIIIRRLTKKAQVWLKMQQL